MPEEYANSLQFTLEEQVNFDPEFRVQEISSISLEPNVTCHAFDEYLILRGTLSLNGTYLPCEQGMDVEETSDFYTVQKNRAQVTPCEDDADAYEFSYPFPVDITIPADRVRSEDELTIGVQSFDCQITENGCLLVSAELAINGVYERGYLKSEEATAMEQVAPESFTEQEEVVPESTEDQTLTNQEDEVISYQRPPTKKTPPVNPVQSQESVVRTDEQGYSTQPAQVAQIEDDLQEEAMDEVSSSWQEADEFEADEATYIHKKIDESSLEVETMENFQHKESIVSDDSEPSRESEDEEQEEVYEETAEESSFDVSAESEREEAYDKIIFPFDIEEDSTEEADFYVEAIQPQPRIVVNEFPEVSQAKIAKANQQEPEPSSTSRFEQILGIRNESSTCLKLHIVQQGDSFEKLALRYSTAASKIARHNQMQPNSEIKEGTILYIPN